MWFMVGSFGKEFGDLLINMLADGKLQALKLSVPRLNRIVATLSFVRSGYPGGRPNLTESTTLCIS